MSAGDPHPGPLPQREREIEYLPAPYLAWRIPDPIEPVRTYADLLHNVGFAHVEDLRILTRAWQTIFALARPDVVLCDHSPTAPLAASLDGIPCATIGTGFCCPPCGGETLPDLRPWIRNQGSGTLAPSLATGGPPRSGGLLSDVGGGTEERVLANINVIRTEHGKAPWERLTELYSSAAETFLTTFAELDHFSSRGDAHYLGVWESEQGKAFEWPRGWRGHETAPQKGAPSPRPSPGKGEGERAPRVFLYTHRFPARDWLLEHLLRRGLPTVVYTHDLPREMAAKLMNSTMPTSGAPPLADFAGQCHPVDQRHPMLVSDAPLNVSQAAAECDVAILNSGHNSAAQFLLAGKPLLLLPIALEQGLLMRRLVEQGLAVSAPPDRPAAIQAALDELLTNPRYRAAARAFAAKYVSYDAEAAQDQIVRQIEQIAGSSRERAGASGNVECPG
jgi:hypothetical protein